MTSGFTPVLFIEIVSGFWSWIRCCGLFRSVRSEYKGQNQCRNSVAEIFLSAPSIHSKFAVIHKNF